MQTSQQQQAHFVSHTMRDASAYENPVKISHAIPDFLHLIANFKIYKINQLFIAH